MAAYLKGIIALVFSVSMLATAASAQDKIPLTVWSDTARLEPFEQFQEAHPNIDLNVVTVAPPDLVAKVQLALQTGTEVPDAIFMAELNYINMLSTRRSNYLMDVSQSVPQEILDGFLPNANNPCWVDGRLLCLRNDLAHMILWYNKPLFEEKGLSVPATWEDFEALGADLVDLGEGHIIGTGVEPFPLIAILTAGGCEIGFPVEGQENTIKIDLTSPGCIRAAEMLDRMIENGSLMLSGAFEPAFVTAAKEGKLALMHGPTWYGQHVMKPVYEFSEGKVAAALPPRWSDETAPLSWSWGGGAFGAWKDSEHPEAVVELLIWMTTDLDLQTSAVTMPAYRDASDSWGQVINGDSYYAANDTYDVSNEAVAFSHPSYGGLRFDAVAAFAKVVGPVISSNGKIVETLADYQEELVNSAKVAKYEVVQ